MTLAGEHPAFTYIREHLPGKLKSIAPVDIAIDAIVNGVVHRKHRVLAPGWLRWALALRWFASNNPAGYKTQMPEIERLCAEENQKRGGPEKTMFSDPLR